MKVHAVVVLFSICTILTGVSTARGQSITTIYSFDHTNGAYPYDSLTLGPDGNFYGTTEGGGDGPGYGTVFKVTTNGALTSLLTFDFTDGANITGSLTLGSDGNFYGTAQNGGSGNDGTVFKVSTNGNLATLADFSGPNGSEPYAGLVLGPDGNFYGATTQGGSNSDGTVFRVTPGGALTTLVNFNGTNGYDPSADLALGPNGNFYGITTQGGSNNDGTVFRVTPSGALTTLVNFNGTNGAYPQAGLTLGPDGNFYGTTRSSGTGKGTVFKVSTNGTLATLVNFAGVNGGTSVGGLTFGPDGNLYGTTVSDANDAGEVFKVTTNGVFTTLATFTGANGANPEARLTLGPDGNFYGTTMSGGDSGVGTIFRLELPPEFVTGPSNQTAVPGGSATFDCQVFGTGPFAYQWLSNGIAIPGATGTSLTVSNVSWQTAMNTPQFQVVAVNSLGAIVSEAKLSVLLPPNIYAISNNGTDGVLLNLGSQPNSSNRLWVTTNLALPFAQWKVIATNVTDGNGLGQFVDTNAAGVSQKFYRLSQP